MDEFGEVNIYEPLASVIGQTLWSSFSFKQTIPLPKLKRGHVCSHMQLAKEALWSWASCIASEHKTRDVRGQGPSNINVSLFVCFFNVYCVFNHFLLSTMVSILDVNVASIDKLSTRLTLSLFGSWDSKHIPVI